MSYLTDDTEARDEYNERFGDLDRQGLGEHYMRSKVVDPFVRGRVQEQPEEHDG